MICLSSKLVLSLYAVAVVYLYKLKGPKPQANHGWNFLQYLQRNMSTYKLDIKRGWTQPCSWKEKTLGQLMKYWCNSNSSILFKAKFISKPPVVNHCWSKRNSQVCTLEDLNPGEIYAPFHSCFSLAMNILYSPLLRENNKQNINTLLNVYIISNGQNDLRQQAFNFQIVFIKFLRGN